MRKILLLLVLLLSQKMVMAQYSKVHVGTEPNNLKIEQIDFRESSTLVCIKVISPTNDHIANINENSFIRIKGSNKKYPLINSINMPIGSEAEDKRMLFDYAGQEHYFALEFEKVPVTSCFDIIENEANEFAFNFHEVIIDTLEKKDYVNLDKMVEDYPIVRERGMYLKNNILIQYVKAKDIVLTMYVQAVKEYGKYYTVNMDLQNFSGKSILFALNNVSAEGYIVQEGKPIKTIPLEVLSSYEYDKKVARKQAWNNFWVALGEGMAASNAGYSSSVSIR